MTTPVMIESKMGPIPAGGTPCWRWLCQPMSSGLWQGEIIPGSVLPAFAAAMPGRPVRWVTDNGALVHPSVRVDPEHPAHRVGELESAWVVGDTRHGVVRAVIRLDPDAARLQYALTKMHVQRRLRFLLGVSILAKVERAVDHGAHYIVGLTEVIALDFGTVPAMRDARLLRPLAPDENPNPNKEPSHA